MTKINLRELFEWYATFDQTKVVPMTAGTALALIRTAEEALALSKHADFNDLEDDDWNALDETLNRYTTSQ